MDLLLAEHWISHNWLITVGVIIAIYLIGVPLLVFWSFASEADPTIELLNREETPLPGVVAEHLDTAELSLQQAGFEPQGVFFLPRQSRDVRVLGALFLNRPAEVIGTAVTMYFRAKNGWRVMQYLLFSTRYHDGRVINTGNSREVGLFKSAGNKLSTHIPWITDPIELYEVHKAIVAKRGAEARKDLQFDTEFFGDSRAYLANSMHEEYEAATESGYLRLDAAGTHYRATFKGAYLMTWKLLQPFKFFLRRARDRRAKRMLAEVGLGDWRADMGRDPPPTHSR